MQKRTILLSVLIIVSLALLVSTVTKATFNNESSGNHYTVNLEESLSMSDSLEVHKPHPLVGTLVYSADGSICWKIEEKQGALYYKIQSDCQNA